MKKITSLLILLLISGCLWFKNADTAQLAFTNIKVPNGTPKFQKGYKDGCATVLYTRGNVLYRTRYDYELDASLLDDQEYSFGRKSGYRYCFNYIVGTGHLGGGWDSYLYAKGTAFNMGKGSIDNTVIGRASGSDPGTGTGKANSVWDTWGDTAGGVDGSLGVLQSNRANSGGVMGGHAFYGKTQEQQNQILGW